MNLKPPKPPVCGGDQECFLSPCYEQLRGCYYGISKAETNGFGSGNRPDVTKLDHSPPDDQNWRAGFYFNSTLHRIAWANDRLLLLFAYLPDAPDKVIDLRKNKNKKQNPTALKTVVCTVRQRLKVAPLYGCCKVQAVLSGLSHAKVYDYTVLDTNYLSIIRDRVNVQKHAIEGFPYSGRATAPTGSWEVLSDACKLAWVRKGIGVLTDAYNELHDLYFERSVLHVPTSIRFDP